MKWHGTSRFKPVPAFSVRRQHDFVETLPATFRMLLAVQVRALIARPSSDEVTLLVNGIRLGGTMTFDFTVTLSKPSPIRDAGIGGTLTDYPLDCQAVWRLKQP